MDSKFGGGNIAHAVFCCLALGCGNSYSVLTTALLNFFYGRFGIWSFRAGITVMWMYGLAWIVPAVAGLIAAGLRKKEAYIVHVTLSVIAIGTMVTTVTLFLRRLALFDLSDITGSGTCSLDINGMCTCQNPAVKYLLEDFSCDEMNWNRRTGIAIAVMSFGGGAVTIISAVLSGILYSKVKQNTQPQATIPMVNMAAAYPNIE